MLLSARLATVLLAASSVWAVPTPYKRAIDFGVNLPAPDTNYDINLTNGKRLILFNAGEPPRWVPETEVLGMTIEERGFMDVTHLWETAYRSDFEAKYGEVVSTAAGFSFAPGAAPKANLAADAAPARSFAVPAGVSRQTRVRAMQQLINMTDVRANINTFVAFPNRRHNLQTGVDSANWLFDRATAVVGSAGTVKRVQHAGFQQPSVVATIPGKEPGLVILGSHQDSISNAGADAPGADDDASGSMTIMEAMRVTAQAVSQGLFTPAQTLEFHWYAGEEAGLLGSQDIAQQYKAANANVSAMMQIDMTGFAINPQDRQIAVMTDNTTPELVAFTKALMAEYSTTRVVESQCGFACSDHASWTQAGFPAVLPAEGTINEITPFIHTNQDTVANLNFEHIEDFVKLAVAFMGEASLGEDGAGTPSGTNVPATNAPTAAPTDIATATSAVISATDAGTTITDIPAATGTAITEVPAATSTAAETNAPVITEATQAPAPPGAPARTSTVLATVTRCPA
ncbi:Leucine aminopeptidase 1 [Gaertneriomyces sp. JEL0708]|nr:Leucine aminopeptidase 1 [Gaertneriomyces sp. JEL0708]